MSPIETYTLAREAQEASCKDWQLWFSNDLDEETEAEVEARAEEAERAGYPVDVAAQMLEEGETFWGHPGWIADLYEVFRLWSNEGRLIRLKMLSQWLLSTLPEDPIDGDIKGYLQALASGDFCSAFIGASSFWPQKPEFYLVTLDWGMVPYALDSEASYRADGRVWMVKKWGKAA